MIVGYARVSTDGQSLEAQQAALKAAGAERIFAEKISGAVTERKALARAIAALQWRCAVGDKARPTGEIYSGLAECPRRYRRQGRWLPLPRGPNDRHH